MEAVSRTEARLQREGLFDESRKRPLPRPARARRRSDFGSGAALRDILNILGRRFAGIEIIVWPVRVQGEGAAEEIAHAIERMGALRLCDVIIAGRGGGSMEDLWAFNEEIVARAVAACPFLWFRRLGMKRILRFAILWPTFAPQRQAPRRKSSWRAEKTRLAESVRVAAGRLGRAQANGLRQRRAHVESLAQSYALAEPLARLRQCVMRRDELAETPVSCHAFTAAGA
jgi:exodeoxyribonuclease VII large subunit